MAKIKGNDLILFIQKEGEYKALAYSTTCEIDIQAGTIEIGSPDTGQWTKKKKKRKTWRVSSGHLISDSENVIDIFNMLVGTEEVSIMIGTVAPHALSMNADDYVTDERLTMKGRGLITRMTTTGKKGDFVTMSIEIEGCSVLDVKIKEPTPFVTIDEGTLSVIRQGGDYAIHVSANTDWRNDYHPSWVTLSQESGGAGEFDVVVTVSPNTTSESREDDIGFVTLVEGGEGANCVVTQTAEGDFIIVSPNSVEFDGEGSSASVQVISTSEWSYRSKPDWISLDNIQGPSGTLTVMLSALENNTGKRREDYVSFYSNGMSALLNVMQSAVGSIPYVRPTSNYVFFNTNNKGSQLLELDTNVGIGGITSAPLAGSWTNCSLQESGGKKYLKIDVDYNNGSDPRVGLIALILSDGATEAHIITVGQMGVGNDVITYGPLIYIGPTPTIIPEDAIPRSLSQLRYYVICDNDWTVTEQTEFSQMDTSDGGLEGVPTMTEVCLNVSANGGTVDRSGDIVMSSRYFSTVTMALTQKSTGGWIGLSGGDFRSVTNAAQDISIKFPSNLSTSQIEDVRYEILDGGTNWIDYTNKSISGSQFTYTFSVHSNSTGAAREARILFESSDILPIVITISQQA